MKKLWVALILTLASQIATAGQFNWRVQGSGDTVRSTDLNGHINDLVTDKFTNKYPTDKWTIYIFVSSISTGSVTPSLSFVNVGVARKGIMQGVQPANRVFNRFSSNPYVTTDASLMERKSWLIDEIRIALGNMMADCAINPNCNID